MPVCRGRLVRGMLLGIGLVHAKTGFGIRGTVWSSR